MVVVVATVAAVLVLVVEAADMERMIEEAPTDSYSYYENVDEDSVLIVFGFSLGVGKTEI